MSIGQLIALGAIVVPAFTAFLIGYWHRKQLRQLEAYRRDPSVGLVPPPSVLWTFVTSRWKLLLTAGVPALLIAAQFYFQVPVTRATVLWMALNVSSIVGALLLELIEKIVALVERIVSLQEKMVSSEQEHLDLTEKVASALLPRKPRGPGV